MGRSVATVRLLSTGPIQVEGLDLKVGEPVEVVPATWDGLMAILDRYYPEAVFTGESGDPGAKLVAAIREVHRAR